jgi:hypothetical protein
VRARLIKSKSTWFIFTLARIYHYHWEEIKNISEEKIVPVFHQKPSYMLEKTTAE